MKILSLGLALALSTAPALAQVAVPNLAPLPAPKLATVTPFITGLKEPEGMALDPQGNFLVCDYGAGQVLKFSRDGKAFEPLATGLKGPSQIDLGEMVGVPRGRISPVVFVTERNANRVIAIDNEGTIIPLGGEIAEPVELLNELNGLKVLSLTTSKIYRWQNPMPMLNNIPLINLDRIHIYDNIPTNLSSLFRSKSGLHLINPKGKWEALPDDSPANGLRAQSSSMIRQEVGKRLLAHIGDPNFKPFPIPADASSLVVDLDGMIYGTSEANGGQLVRINNEGQKTVVAEKLGRPHSILFLGAKTALVSNRDGNIWKIALP